jgi:Tol biopolymer transport system component
VLVHANQLGFRGELRWFDRAGAMLGAVTPEAEYLNFELSPDERLVAMSRVDPQPNSADIWLLDLNRKITSRFTTDRLHDASPLWSPDGGRIVFRNNRRGTTDLYQKRSSGAGADELLLSTGSTLIASDWSTDGRYIVFTDTNPVTGFDIWVWPTADGQKPTLAVRTPLNEMHGRLSPDGRWMAYASDESGELQVYVQPFPATGDKKQISSNGGAEPRWRRDGNELFYLASNRALMSVSIPAGSAFNAGVPQALFDTRAPLIGNPYRSNYSVIASGQRFLVNTRLEETPSPITVVLNWTAGLDE